MPNDTTPEENGAAASPSSGFLATMKLVTSGERNPRSLQQAASEHVSRQAAPAPGQTPATKDTAPGKRSADSPAPAERQPPAQAKPPAEEKPKKAPAGLEPSDEKPPGDKPDGQPEGEPDKAEEKPQPEKKPAKEKKSKLTREDLERAATGADDESGKEAEDTSEDATPEERELLGIRETDPKSFQKRIRHYEGIVESERKGRRHAEEELKRLRETNQQLETRTKAVPDNFEEEMKALRVFRRRYDLEHDPEIREKFVSKIEASNQTVAETLKQANVPEWYIKEVEKAGSLSGFLRSGAKFKLKAADGKGTEEVAAAEVHKRVLGMLDDADRELLQAEIVEQRRIQRDRSKFEEEAVKEADEYFKNLDQTRSQSAAEEARRLEEIDNGVKRFQADVFEEDWIKDVATPEDASSEVKSRNAATNRFRGQVRDFFTQLVSLPALKRAAAHASSAEELNEIGQMVVDATRSFSLKREITEANARIKELETQLSELKSGASRTTPKTNKVKRTASAAPEIERHEGESDLHYEIRKNRLKAAGQA